MQVGCVSGILTWDHWSGGSACQVTVSILEPNFNEVFGQKRRVYVDFSVFRKDLSCRKKRLRRG